MAAIPKSNRHLHECTDLRRGSAVACSGCTLHAAAHYRNFTKPNGWRFSLSSKECDHRRGGGVGCKRPEAFFAACDRAKQMRGQVAGTIGKLAKGGAAPRGRAGFSCC